jgi:hypothetical protein
MCVQGEARVRAGIRDVVSAVDDPVHGLSQRDIAPEQRPAVVEDERAYAVDRFAPEACLVDAEPVGHALHLLRRQRPLVELVGHDLLETSLLIKAPPHVEPD